MIVAIPCFKTGDKLLVHPHFGMAKLFAIYKIESGSRRLIALEENPALDTPRGRRGEVIASMLERYGVNAVLTHEIGPGGYESLARRGIKIYLVDKTVTVEEALEMFEKNALVEATGPVEHHHHDHEHEHEHEEH